MQNSWYHRVFVWLKFSGDTSNMGFCGFFLLWLSWYFCYFEDFLQILKFFVRFIILKIMIRMNQSESLGVCSSSPFPSPYLFVSRWSQFDNFKAINVHHLIVEHQCDFEILKAGGSRVWTCSNIPHWKTPTWRCKGARSQFCSKNLQIYFKHGKLTIVSIQ